MIDTVNREIVDAVTRRTDLAEEIGDRKAEQDIDVVDEDREQVVREQFHELFREHNLPEDRADDLAAILIEIATEAQR